MKKILIVSYYFPPSAKAGAHRAYSMAEYLPRFGWEPVFVAPRKGYFGRAQRLDPKLLRIFDPFTVYRVRFHYPFAGSRNHLVARVCRRLWEYIWVPDGKYSWLFTLRRRMKAIIAQEKPQVVFITATPFSSFLLAAWIKKRFDLPIVLDYRDPWIGNTFIARKNPLYKILSPRQERKALSYCDMVTAASFKIIDFIHRNSDLSGLEIRTHGFPYGFSHLQFAQMKKHMEPILPRKGILGIFAGFVHGDISVREILHGIQRVCEERPDIRAKLRIHCYGTLFGCSKDPHGLIAEFGLRGIVTLFEFVPYEKYLSYLMLSDFLILPHGTSSVATVLYPTKFFDYLGTGKPILYWGGEGQVWETIKKYKAGICACPGARGIADSIALMVRIIPEFSSPDVSDFSRERIFKKLSGMLDKLSQN